MKKWDDEEVDTFSVEPKEMSRLAKEAADCFVAEESAKLVKVSVEEKTSTQQ